MIQLNKDEQKTLATIKATPYMQKTIALVDDFVAKHASKNEKIAWLAVFDEIFRILNEAKFAVDIYLSDRKAKGEIKDEKQALKSIAGNSFSFTLVYIFLKNKKIENIRLSELA